MAYSNKSFLPIFLSAVLMLALGKLCSAAVVVLGDNFYVIPASPCNGKHLDRCLTSSKCEAAGGYWWSDNTCLGIPESETVVSAGGRIWMDRNLGASRVAISLTDAAAYGDYYQWGRGADGHQLATSSTTSITSSTDVPGHGQFITTDSDPNDWRVPQNDNLWQGVAGTNNPCPAGFRLPTAAEWETESSSWTQGGFASPLKLVLAGYRYYGNGFFSVGSVGYYWSSDVNGSNARFLSLISNNAAIGSGYRADGRSVRCIKN